MADEEQVEGRRLIIVGVEPGMEPSIDYDGPFAPWEVIAALNEAVMIVVEAEAEDADADKGE